MMSRLSRLRIRLVASRVGVVAPGHVEQPLVMDHHLLGELHVALGRFEPGRQREVQKSGRFPLDELPLVLEPVDARRPAHDPREAEVEDGLRLGAAWRQMTSSTAISKRWLAMIPRAILRRSGFVPRGSSR